MLIGTPSVTSHVAYECRRSWKRSPPYAAAATWATAAASLGNSAWCSAPARSGHCATHRPGPISATRPSSPARTRDGNHTRRRKFDRRCGPPSRSAKINARPSGSVAPRRWRNASARNPGSGTVRSPARLFGYVRSMIPECVSIATWTTRRTP
ncbi:hypothetical protein GA0074694_1796 [Micromonospora inyonensis]|uniref:Uncharacterized protein n=1 Tax=Micromonospora inyonensis TaxID=47866 RepID=A0A1C6RI98_9ACTN|nr:hypothetical protein GA0074694_1796 [Micromonospora inyonensis]